MIVNLKKALSLILFSLIFFSFISIDTIQGKISPKEGEEYLAFAQEMPQPVGGLPAVYKKITYPDVAREAGIQGKVYLLVFVNTDGSVGDVKVVRSLGGGCDEAAMTAVKATKFTPGKNKGQTVKVKLTMAIEFKLA